MIRPSKRLKILVAAYDSPRQAALAWGIAPWSLERFLAGQGGLSLDTAGQIAASTGLPFEALFQKEKKS